MAEQSSNGPATGGFDFAAFSAARAGQPSDMKILGSAEGPSLIGSSRTVDAPALRSNQASMAGMMGDSGFPAARSRSRRSGSSISSLSDSIGEMQVRASDKPAGTCTSCGGGSSAGASSLTEMAGDSPPAMTSGQTQESLPGGESFNNGDLPSRNPANNDFRSDDSFLELGGGHDPSLGLQIGLPAGASRPAPGSLASRLGMDFAFEGVAEAGAGIEFNEGTGLADALANMDGRKARSGSAKSWGDGSQPTSPRYSGEGVDFECGHEFPLLYDWGPQSIPLAQFKKCYLMHLDSNQDLRFRALKNDECSEVKRC